MSSDKQQDDTSENGAIHGQSGTFTCFPELPREIRLQIWREVARQPRNVDIYIKSAHIDPRSGKSKRQSRQFNRNSTYRHPLPSYQIVSRSPHPAVLQTCQESLYECRQFFSLEFGVVKYSPSTTNQHTTVISPARVYVQWELDRLCLINSSVLDSDLEDATNFVLARATTMKATSVALNAYQHQCIGHTFYHVLALIEFAWKAAPKEVIMVWQPRLNKNGASIDANGKINWTFTDVITNSRYGQHDCMNSIRYHFPHFLQGFYMTEEEFALPSSERRRVLLSKKVPTKLRVCNEYEGTAGGLILKKK